MGIPRHFPGLVVTIGCPGAGKSTWAEENLPEMTLRLERDRFRECLFGSRQAYYKHPLERDIKSFMVTESMITAQRAWPVNSWAVTDTGMLFTAVKPFIRYAQLRRVPVTLIVFERSKEYLREINHNRAPEERVPDEILDDMIARFNDPDAWWKQDHGYQIMEARR